MKPKRATFKGHQIIVDKENPFANWYIQVVAPDGCYAYDGYWRNSVNKTAKEAIAEARRGAQI